MKDFRNLKEHYLIEYQKENGLGGRKSILATSEEQARTIFTEWVDKNIGSKVKITMFGHCGTVDERFNIKQNKYLLIDMEKVNIKLLRNKTDFEKGIVPFDCVDEFSGNDYYDLKKMLKIIVTEFGNNNNLI